MLINNNINGLDMKEKLPRCFKDMLHNSGLPQQTRQQKHINYTICNKQFVCGIVESNNTNVQKTKHAAEVSALLEKPPSLSRQVNICCALRATVRGYTAPLGIFLHGI